VGLRRNKSINSCVSHTIYNYNEQRAKQNYTAPIVLAPA
jgi:hypothetical protein